MLPINFLAILVAAVVAFIIGFLFHGPVFGKLWMKLANITPTGNEKLSDMIPQMVWNFVINFITAYVFAVIYLYISTSPFSSNPGVSTALITAFCLWLGFIATSTSVDVIWMGKSFKLWLFEAISSLVMICAMGAIIASF